MFQERIAAAKAIPKREDRAEALDRLVVLLEGDLLSADMVYVIGDIGDPRVVPRLREFQRRILMSEDVKAGKLNTALIYVIKQLEGTAAPD